MNDFRARQPLALFGLALAGFFSPIARADDSPFRLVYAAPRACPDAAEFTRRVEEKSQHGRLIKDQSLARTLHVSIRVERTQHVGRLEFVDLESQRVVRELAAPDCSALMEALVLVTALAIDAQLPPSPGLDRAEIPDVYRAPPFASFLAEPARSLPGSAERGPALASPGRALVLGALGRLNTAAVPALGGGVVGLVELPRAAGGPRVELGGSWGTGRTTQEGERARIDWLTAVATACPVALSIGRRVEVSPCGGIELGALLGKGEQSTRITTPETRSTGYFAWSLLAELWAPMTPNLGLKFEAGLTFPVTRPQFEFNRPDLLVFRPPWVGLVTGLGLGFELE